MDGLTGAYFASMASGTGFYLVSLAMGHGAHGGHALSAHGSHGGPAHSSPFARGGLQGASGIGGWLLAGVANLAAVSAVAAVGGAAGYLGRLDRLAAIPSLLVAIPCGLGAGLAVHALAAWIGAQTRYRLPAEMPGTVAHVLVPAEPGHVGEVSYEQDGLRRTIPARSQQAEDLHTGAEVVIVDVQDGIARVISTQTFLMDGKP